MILKDVRSNYNGNGSAMMTEKRFWYDFEDWNGAKIVDFKKDKEYPVETIGDFRGIEELLNSLNDENEQLEKRLQIYKSDGLETLEKLQRCYNNSKKAMKMLDNVFNYMQKQHKEMPLDDFVEWWNNIATAGLGGDNGVDGNKIRKRKVKVDGRVDYVGISKEDLE